MKSFFIAASAAMVAVCATVLVDRSAQGQAANAYTGEVMTFPYNFCPVGWLQTSGQILPINQHQALFSLLGTQYGGDGKTTFALPKTKPVPTETGGTMIQCISLFGVYPPRN